MKPRAPEPEVGDVVAVKGPKGGDPVAFNVSITHTHANGQCIGRWSPGTIGSVELTFPVSSILAYGRIPNA